MVPAIRMTQSLFKIGLYNFSTFRAPGSMKSYRGGDFPRGRPAQLGDRNRLRDARMTCLFKRAPAEWYRTRVGSRLRRRSALEWGNYNQCLRGQRMKPNPKIAAAVAAILSAPSTMIVYAAPADTETATAGNEITEVVVTAQRRSENLQDVPITIQAISGQQLQQLNVVGFNDLLKYTPNVTFSGNGPGTGNIFMRGLGGSGSGNQSQSTTAPFPNVALYLDDQSMQFPARNNDVYLVDMERVEVLEGPQGTLFGGGAQAGAIRYITNKPRLDATSGEVNGRLRHHRRRGPEHRSERGAQRAGGRRQVRSARGSLLRPSRRLHRQHPGDHRLHPGHRYRTTWAATRRRTTARCRAPTPTRSMSRACGSPRCGGSTTAGTRCCSRTTRTCIRTAISMPIRPAPTAGPCSNTSSLPSRRRSARIATRAPR